MEHRIFSRTILPKVDVLLKLLFVHENCGFPQYSTANTNIVFWLLLGSPTFCNMEGILADVFSNGIILANIQAASFYFNHYINYTCACCMLLCLHRPRRVELVRQLIWSLLKRFNEASPHHSRFWSFKPYIYRYSCINMCTRRTSHIDTHTHASLYPSLT